MTRHRGQTIEAVKASRTRRGGSGEMRDLLAGDLRISVEASASSPIVCTWTGKSNSRHPDQDLAPFFSEILRDAAKAKASVEMHFESLEHFNSSTITALIQLIQDAQTSQVPLAFVYDDGLKWQKLSFEALRAFERSDAMFRLRTVRD